MANPQWITPASSLGLVPENEFYQFKFQVDNPAIGDLAFSHLAGDLPPGLQVTKVGYLQGVPIITNPVSTSNDFTFSVRAKNALGKIADRSFTMSITNIVPPRITPRDKSLGEFFDGDYLNVQLFAADVNPNIPLTWSIQNGNLPRGVSLNATTGLISGYVYPLPVQGSAGLSGYDDTRFNEYGYDNFAQYRNQTYTFTVSVWDGANWDSISYNLNIVARGGWRADATQDSINDTFLTVDSSHTYLPVVTTPPQSLPQIRSGSQFAFQFSGLDPQNDQISFLVTTQGGSNFDTAGIGFDTTKFDQSGYGIPPGLGMDPATGWLTGFIPLQSEVSATYNFAVQAYKTNDPEFVSQPIQYSLTVLGDILNTITWNSNSDLGYIDNGAVSEFVISATSNLGKKLYYSLAANSRLPQGLTILPSGLISGRATFEYFSIDSGSTTIDGSSSTTFDNRYTFHVLAEDFAQTVSDVKTFTITVNNYNKLPYENLYITALLGPTERQLFHDIVNNNDIFPEQLLYRSSDPWFGRARDIRSLFLAGLNPTLASSYISAMGRNHFTKSLEWGDIKTAVALDANFNVKYEVVYMELIDSVSPNGKTPNNIIDLSGSINPWLDAAGNGYTVDYPNTNGNMTSAIVSSVGYAHQGALPVWMTSPQENNKPLGFVNAVVLAYTVPGASKLIAYRLSTKGLVFNDIGFVVDRYQLDNTLTSNFNVSINSFVNAKETSWDRISRIGTVKHNAKYAITGIPFDNINGKTVSHIRALGGLDGVVSFEDGDTLIFAQQEGYGTTFSPYIIINNNEGWNNIDGTAVPGYLEKLHLVSPVNKRAGIWKINIVTPEGEYVPTLSSDFGNDLVGFDSRGFDFNVDNVNPSPFPTQVVMLEFVEEVIPGEQIQINNGTTYNNSILFYDPVVHHNRGVPEYSRVTNQTSILTKFTKFDNGGTRFINNRDSYAVPEQQNKYLKFPKHGVFE
jgi:hypothetical protein